MMDDADIIIDSDLFKPNPGRSEHDFPGRFRDYCESRGLNPEVAALDGEIEFTPQIERAIKARLMVRRLTLEK